MDNKRLIIILSIWTVIFTLMGGTLAYWNWQSADNKKTNVTFTVNRDYTCGADSGGHITSSDVRLAPAKCTDSVYAIKRPITTSVTTTGDKVVSMDLWLNINNISSNLTNTTNFKWVITKNGNTCNGAINQGDFRNIQNNKIDLLDGVEYATLDDTYYLYIWLDEAETNTNTMNQSFDFSIGGYCEDSGLQKSLLKHLNTTAYFRENDYKTAITDIYFTYDEDLPSGIITNNIKTYDLGANASKPITGYLIENTDVGADPNTYKLYISSEYKIYAQNLQNAFQGMTALKNITFDNFDTSGTPNMASMFGGCSSLTSLNLSSFNTSKVESMMSMFYGCSGLTSLDVSSFDISHIVTSNGVNNLFNSCSSLTSLDVSNFDTSGLSSMYSMFSGCSSLTSLDLSYFDTSNIMIMTSLFNGCSSLTTLDLSSFNTSNVSSMMSMFNGCSSLQNIYVSERWSTDAVTDSRYMFANDTNLPNYNGTFDVSNAHYGSGGYLTYKAYSGSN